MPAKSKAQQRFFGMVHAYQKGELDNPSKAIKDAAKSITKKGAKEFAKTKHKGLPNHVKKSKKTNENKISFSSKDISAMIMEAANHILREEGERAVASTDKLDGFESTTEKPMLQMSAGRVEESRGRKIVRINEDTIKNMVLETIENYLWEDFDDDDEDNEDGDYFDRALDKINAEIDKNGGRPIKKTFGPKDLAPGDTWLIQVARYGKKETLTFKRSNFGIISIWFDDDSYRLLENVPDSFLRTINKNF